MIKSVAHLDQQTLERDLDWEKISYLLMMSRAVDDIEEQTLVPEKLVNLQFSARGHDLDAHPRGDGHLRFALVFAVAQCRAPTRGQRHGRDLRPATPG